MEAQESVKAKLTYKMPLISSESPTTEIANTDGSNKIRLKKEYNTQGTDMTKIAAASVGKNLERKRKREEKKRLPDQPVLMWIWRARMKTA